MRRREKQGKGRTDMTMEVGRQKKVSRGPKRNESSRERIRKERQRMLMRINGKTERNTGE